MSVVIDWAERAVVPDVLIRLGIRHIVAGRLKEERSGGPAEQLARYQALMTQLRSSDIALLTDLANEQHYEVAAGFFELCLGKRLKYSSALWNSDITTLDAAEDAMLELYGSRAQLAAGQKVLDLGCGWGSFTLWAANRFPESAFTAVSNSASQREFIEAQANARGLQNIRVITADINSLELPAERFDRVVSVEMFEHVRNYAQLLARINAWLAPGGSLFVHIFCHHRFVYPYETEGASNWMGRYFFSGGLMPARDTLLHFQDHLRLNKRWDVAGTHYQRTARAWLENLDRNRIAVRAVLAETYPASEVDLWTQRWRMFFMACEELFGYDNGSEWQVCHYLFDKPQN